MIYLNDGTSLTGPRYRQFDSLKDAKAQFLRDAKELARYGQVYEVSLHLASSVEQIQEYPDYALSLGPKGGLKCEKT